ncbi:MAG: glycosyltransferase, partial [Desulfobacterales bacterium]|nr:glycosyltransferase [Desulfobacterales bacterium]
LTNPTVPEPFRVAQRSKVRIGPHAIEGANAVIMPGVTIGEGAAIGACSLVRHDCQPWTIYAGVPARPIGKRSAETIIALEQEFQEKHMKTVVSICCLTYNQAGLIRDALDSFLMQRTDFAFEVVIHDDASTDGTAEILKEYAERFPGIVRPLFEEENQFSKTGVYPILPCYRAARGRYIAECDGDDYWTDPRKLQKQVEFLEKNPAFVMCHHDYLIEEAGKRRKPHADPPRDFSTVEMVGYQTTGHGIGFCTRMFRNCWSAQRAADIEAMAGDYPMVVYLGTIGKCKYIPGISPSIYRRLNGTNSWCSLPPQEIEARTRAMHRRIYEWFAARGDIQGL